MYKICKIIYDNIGEKKTKDEQFKKFSPRISKRNKLKELTGRLLCLQKKQLKLFLYVLLLLLMHFKAIRIATTHVF